MNVFQNGGKEFRLLGVFRLEWVQHGFVITGGIDASLHSQLIHGSHEPKTIADHADRTYQTGRVGIDLIRRGRNIVSSGCTDVGNHCVDLFLRILLFEALHLSIHQTGLYRAAAGTVHPQDDAFGMFRFERIAQPFNQAIGTGFGIVGNHALHIHQSHMGRAGADGGGTTPHTRVKHH